MERGYEYPVETVEKRGRQPGSLRSASYAKACGGKVVTFVAAAFRGAEAPRFQWKLTARPRARTNTTCCDRGSAKERAGARDILFPGLKAGASTRKTCGVTRRMFCFPPGPGEAPGGPRGRVRGDSTTCCDRGSAKEAAWRRDVMSRLKPRPPKEKAEKRGGREM